MKELGDLTSRLIELALLEDLGPGDITSEATISPDLKASAIIVAKSSLVVCGQQVAREVFLRVDPSVTYDTLVNDGNSVTEGQTIARISGAVRSLLSAERVALNFLQRLSGIATTTSRVVKLVEGCGVKILDTRKTTPGQRVLEKYAVACGGGTNHRIGLFDAFLIKDNHIDALSGDLAKAIELCRKLKERGFKIEVEVRDLKELRAAISASPDAILLDNMSPDQLRNAVQMVRGESPSPIELEASGGITESNIRDYAETGVDSISLGMLTHSVQAVDLSLLYERGE